MNFVFVSPNFPIIYSKFVKSLNERGFHVLGIGDTAWNDLNDELKNYGKNILLVYGKGSIKKIGLYI